MEEKQEIKKSQYYFTLDSYKDIRNYIHNYLGIRKEEIRDMFWDFIKDIIDEEITKCLNDEPRIERLVEDKIVAQIRKLDIKNRHSYPTTIMDRIYLKIDEEIAKIVQDKIIVTLKQEEQKES